MNALLIMVGIVVLSGLIAGIIFWMIAKKKPKSQQAQQLQQPQPEQSKLKRNLSKIRSDITGETDQTHYGIYVMSMKERIATILMAGGFFALIGYIFYQSIVVAVLFALLGLYFPKVRAKQLMEKRKEELNWQFKQALYSLSTGLSVGKSVENAFREVIADLKLIYPEGNVAIIREIDLINHKVENGDTIENALYNFSMRAEIEDITNFADVFMACKRTGGNMIEVARKSAGIIGEKLEIQQEISVLVAQKKFESIALSVAPLAIVALLTFSSPDYMAPLYKFPGMGPIIMTISLAMMVGSAWVTYKIMNIKV